MTRSTLRAQSAHPKLAPALANAPGVSGGAVPREPDGRVLVSVQGPDAAAVRAAIVGVGGEVSLEAPGSILALVDPSQLGALSDNRSVERVATPRRLRPYAVPTEGVDDFQTNRVGATSARTWQTAGRDGAGASVAIVDVGFAGLAAEQLSGALPVVTMVNHCGPGLVGFDGSGPTGSGAPQSHGTAVAEIVHQMAPAASLTLICVYTTDDVYSAEIDIENANIKIVNMSLGDPLDGRGDGSGWPFSMAAAVARGRQHGQLWTVAAGNDAQRHFNFPSHDSDADGAVEMFPALGTTPGPDASEVFTFILDPSATTDILMKWDDWPVTSREYDMCLWRDTVSPSTFVDCWQSNTTAGGKPVDELRYTNSSGAAHVYYLAMFPSRDPGSNRIDLYFEGQERSLEATTLAGSLTEPATSSEVLTVGAHCYADARVEAFSGAGPTIDGRLKPELTGPDGISTNQFGPASLCSSSGFFGTSASAPHAAGAAALVKGQFPTLNSDQIKQFLVARAVQAGPAANSNQAGAGKLDLGSLLSLPQHDPTGTVDSVRRQPGGVRLQGWTIDPDTSASISVKVFDNGSMTGSSSASLNRPDVGGAFPGYGAAHGYDVTVPVTPGSHSFCVTGVNAAGTRGIDRSLKCVTLVVSGSPFGSFDSFARAPGGMRLSGWTIDPDTSNPILVDAYVDGSGAEVTANQTRTDVGNAFPAYGPQHGYSAVVPTGPGHHLACTYGINGAGAGGNTQLGCFSFDVSSQPIGSLDSVVRVPSGFRVSGWSIDPDVAGQIQVHAYLDGAGTALLANTSRPDVGAVFPDWGPNHGYNATIVGGTAPGVHTLCAYGINVAAGSNTQLECVNVAVSGSPFGSADSIVLSGGTVTASGWAIDPDTSASIQVHVYVDGTGVAAIANGSRPDVGAVFPSYGAAHGYSVATNFPFGTHTVCAYAINAAGPGNNVQLGCRTLTR